jgi:hypothetical protein
MLWRYVGVTLVALGGAMLIAPDAAERPSPALQTGRPDATETSALAKAARSPKQNAGAERSAAGAVTREVANREAETLLPAALDLVAGADVTESAGDGGARLAMLDGELSDAPAPPGELSGSATASGEQLASAPPPADLPTLERPGSLRPAEITAETLALIERTEDAQTTSPASGAEQDPDRLFVSGSRVNVRSGPSTSYAVIGSTVYGEEVELLAVENESWAWVRFGDDREGYMARSFLAPDLGDG